MNENNPIRQDSSEEATRRSVAPRARGDDLVVEEVGDETLVYDLHTHEAHCLNRSAYLVWRSCDGATTVPQISRRLADAGLPAHEMVVRMGLARLEQAGLLAKPAGTPATARRRYSRREVLRVLGITGSLTLALPAVSSITAPLAAQAASCVPMAQCRRARPPNCTGLPTCENRSQCCIQRGNGRRARCRMRAC